MAAHQVLQARIEQENEDARLGRKSRRQGVQPHMFPRVLVEDIAEEIAVAHDSLMEPNTDTSPMKSRGKCRSQRHKAAKQRGLKTIARRYVEQNAKEYYGDIVTARCNIEMHNHEEEEGVLDPLRRGGRRAKEVEHHSRGCCAYYGGVVIACLDSDSHEEEEGVLKPFRRGGRRRKTDKPSGQHCPGQQSEADVLAQDVLVGLCAAKFGPIRTSQAGG